jgi:hypothetical protein
MQPLAGDHSHAGETGAHAPDRRALRRVASNTSSNDADLSPSHLPRQHSALTGARRHSIARRSPLAGGRPQGAEPSGRAVKVRFVSSRGRSLLKHVVLRRAPAQCNSAIALRFTTACLCTLPRPNKLVLASALVDWAFGPVDVRGLRPLGSCPHRRAPLDNATTAYRLRRGP